MHYRRLGSAGTQVSAISLGGWINFESKIPQDEAEKIIRTAYDAGVNFYDVADVYGRGEAERWMGGMLRAFPRHTLVISTKVFGAMSEDINDRGLSRKHIMESIDKSLARLGTDYVDIYFCHRPDKNTPLLETCRTMSDLIHSGKVIYWGTSEFSADLLREIYAICERYNLYPPQVEQPKYSMLYRENVENNLTPLAQEQGLGLTVFSPLAMGMLTGKYDAGIPEDSRLHREDWAKEEVLSDSNVEKVKALKPIADELRTTRAGLALAWALRNPEVSSLITGATKLSQIEANLKALDVKLTDDVLARIDGILA